MLAVGPTFHVNKLFCTTTINSIAIHYSYIHKAAAIIGSAIKLNTKKYNQTIQVPTSAIKFKWNDQFEQEFKCQNAIEFKIE